MKHYIFLPIFIWCFLIVPPALAEDFDEAFNSGVNFYRQKKYPEARDAFSRSVELRPENTSALVNLALAQFQVGEKNYAMALLRKTIYISPDFSTAKAALNFIFTQTQLKEIPHEIQILEQVRNLFLNPLSLRSYLSLTALMFFAAGWLILKYFGLRRRAFKEEKIIPQPSVITLILSFIFVAVFTLTILKAIDYYTPRGTIILEKVTVHSAPTDQSTNIFDLYGGLEVILKQTDGDWVQVSYPGALTGWIPKSSLLQTSGRKNW